MSISNSFGKILAVLVVSGLWICSSEVGSGFGYGRSDVLAKFIIEDKFQLLIAMSNWIVNF